MNNLNNNARVTCIENLYHIIKGMGCHIDHFDCEFMMLDDDNWHVYLDEKDPYLIHMALQPSTDPRIAAEFAIRLFNLASIVNMEVTIDEDFAFASGFEALDFEDAGLDPEEYKPIHLRGNFAHG